MKKDLTFPPFPYQQAKEKIERVSEVSFFFSSECVLQTNLWPPTVICQMNMLVYYWQSYRRCHSQSPTVEAGWQPSTNYPFSSWHWHYYRTMSTWKTSIWNKGATKFHFALQAFPVQIAKVGKSVEIEECSIYIQGMPPGLVPPSTLIHKSKEQESFFSAFRQQNFLAEVNVTANTISQQRSFCKAETEKLPWFIKSKDCRQNLFPEVNFYFCANWSVVPCQMVGLEGPMGSW